MIFDFDESESLLNVYWTLCADAMPPLVMVQFVDMGYFISGIDQCTLCCCLGCVEMGTKHLFLAW